VLASRRCRRHGALADFRRFPGWMWRNTDIAAFIGWLRSYNDACDGPFARFASTDSTSTASVLHGAVWRTSTPTTPPPLCVPGTVQLLRHWGARVPIRQRRPARSHRPCEREVIAELWTCASTRRPDGSDGQQRGRVLRGRAERSSHPQRRALLPGDVPGRGVVVNLRDEHMAATLANLASHLDQLRGRSKIVVWSTTRMWATPVPLSSVRRASSTWASWCGPPGGGLPAGRIHHDHGRVTAASEWGGPAERKHVRPALEGSYEKLFHQHR